MALTATEAIDTTTEVFGADPGFRALHAKGIVATGVFGPTAEAAALSRAAHLQGPDVPATGRFSNGSGDPRHPDFAPDPRGLAVKLYLPDGLRTDIVAVSTPRVAPTLAPPASYATIAYHALHAFEWTDADGGRRFVRLSLRPAATVARRTSQGSP